MVPVTLWLGLSVSCAAVLGNACLDGLPFVILSLSPGFYESCSGFFGNFSHVCRGINLVFWRVWHGNRMWCQENSLRCSGNISPMYRSVDKVPEITSMTRLSRTMNRTRVQRSVILSFNRTNSFDFVGYNSALLLLGN